MTSTDNRRTAWHSRAAAGYDLTSRTTPAMRTLPRFASVAATLALLAACGERSDTNGSAAADSAFARDIALAQQQVPPQTVFNDAPLGGAERAAPASESPSPARTPRPTPRRQSPPAPVARTPRPTIPQTVPVERAPEPTPAPAPGPAA